MHSKNKYDVPFWENMKYYFSLLKNYKGLTILGLITVLFVQIAKVGEQFIFKVIIDNGEKVSLGILSKGEFVDSLILL